MSSLSIGGGTMLGSLVSGIFGLGGAALQQKYNRELAEYQNQMNIEQWNRENEYNKPINQMARLEEAGINPNLAYSNGSISNTSASSPALSSGSSADYQKAFSNFGSGATDGLKIMLGLLQAQKLVEDTETSHYQSAVAKIQAQKDWADYVNSYILKKGLSYDPDYLDENGQPIIEVSRWALRNSKGKLTDIGYTPENSSLALEIARRQPLSTDAKIANLGFSSALLGARKDYTDEELEQLSKFGPWLKGTQIGKNITDMVSGLGNMITRGFLAGLSKQKGFHKINSPFTQWSPFQ